ncbi:MAG TPA: FAD-dependent oxidoreductase, partial [Candidatus Lokiarchaeia archaeon]
MNDIVIIGGNLSGTAAAIKAAEKGVNVVLVEKNKEPFDPAHCGEMLFDFETEPLNLDKIGCPKNEIDNVILYVPPREYTFKFKKHKIIIFNRNYVEKKLLEKAEKTGAKLILGTSMRDYKPPYEIYLDNNEIAKGKIIID